MLHKFSSILIMVNRQYQKQIKKLQSNGNTKFKSLEAFLFQGGYQRRISRPYTPQHNSIVERKNRHIVKFRLAMMLTEEVPLKFWEYGFRTNVYLI